jgi:sphingomyelin phosphodiesterase
VDFVYYTGDLPPHNVWNQSRADQLYSLTTINGMLGTLFPNITFYPAVGNHETGEFARVIKSTRMRVDSVAPCNLYPTPSIQSENISWLYDALADSWIQLGLPEDTRESIRRGAFYTTVVRRGLRLISLNMNYCDPENYWLLVNTTDPLGQLQWVRSSIRNKDRPVLDVLVSAMVTICRRPRRKGTSDRTSTSTNMSR